LAQLLRRGELNGEQYWPDTINLLSRSTSTRPTMQSPSEQINARCAELVLLPSSHRQRHQISLRIFNMTINEGLGWINFSLWHSAGQHLLTHRIIRLFKTNTLTILSALLVLSFGSLIGGHFADSMDRALRAAQPQNSVKGWRPMQ
jgi:hypothetical protein